MYRPELPHLPHLVAGGLVVLALVGCGGDTPPTVDEPPPNETTSAPVETPASDTPGGQDTGPFGEIDAAAEVAEARALLGTPEDELPGSVRIARRGGEGFAVTDDYVLGRDTVELDEVKGTYVVTSVTVELPDGPRTFTRRR